MTDQTTLAALLTKYHDEWNDSCENSGWLPFAEYAAPRLHAAGVRVTGDAGLRESANATGYHAMAHGNGGNHNYAVTGDTGLDVERLARALKWCHVRADALTVRNIARKYAALATEPQP